MLFDTSFDHRHKPRLRDVSLQVGIHCLEAAGHLGDQLADHLFVLPSQWNTKRGTTFVLAINLGPGALGETDLHLESLLNQTGAGGVNPGSDSIVSRVLRFPCTFKFFYFTFWSRLPSLQQVGLRSAGWDGAPMFFGSFPKHDCFRSEYDCHSLDTRPVTGTQRHGDTTRHLLFHCYMRGT